MREMVERAVLPDLRTRSGDTAAIVSRTLRTWGESESGLAELLTERIAQLDDAGNPTLAFLASGMEGIKVRITAKAADAAAAGALLDAEEAELRALLGPLVFGVDDTTMEAAVGELLVAQGLTLGLAESVTGGLVAYRVTATPGSSTWFRGGVVSYASEVKYDLLGVPVGPVVSSEAAEAMAEGAARELGSDVGLSLTGVAGPQQQEGRPVGTLHVGVHLPGLTLSRELHLPGERDVMRQLATISALDLLRQQLLARAAS
jgi:nicotinamide-nucleotide amidase